MCGIAGIVDISGQRRPIAPQVIRSMAAAIVHRGPDEDGFFERPGLALASRRLSIVGLKDGRQPIYNEDRSVACVFNGELFDYPEVRAELEARGHTFATHCDTEIVPHRWEELQEGMFSQLRGQYAVAVWDQHRQRLALGRDRFGICPLYWTRQQSSDGEWLLFASEIKALLASGMVDARPEPRGINHLFTFFSLPGPFTCFQGVQYLTPGHFLTIQFGGAGERATVREQTYWRLDFPDQGDEDRRPLSALTDELEHLLLAATERRLRADVPVVSYLSGGVDSSAVVALAKKVRGTSIPTFTIQIQAKGLDETAEASIVARHIGANPIVEPVGHREVMDTYPRLILAAEGPVIDTSCAALLLLAQRVHQSGYKVALTGEGADEWLAGYPWHKVNRALSWLDFARIPISQYIRRGFLRLSGAPMFPWRIIERSQAAVGGHNGWHDIYGLMSLSKLRFFSPDMKEALLEHVPYDDLGFDSQNMKRWHPLNRELAVSGRAHLCGHLLNAKGDRIAMHSSVETRYPFLDEAVFDFLAKVPPRYKLRGLTDKYILRKTAERLLPRSIAWRRKAMFRAPFDSFHLDQAPPYVQQLMSKESLEKTGYFDVPEVLRWRRDYQQLWSRGAQRVSVEMGLVGVLATQLWHHTFIDASLCELPGWGANNDNRWSPAELGAAPVNV